MSLHADQISIAITVYDRRDFIEQAIESALNQTIPVKVMVVEDCGPDLALQPFVESKFGTRVKYVRNPQRRGLFGNWNACLEHCETPWLSILHDDDYFKPTFVETMLGLHQAAPGRGLYFGRPMVVNMAGQVVPFEQPTVCGWEEIELLPLAGANLLGFAGHLFPVESVRGLGGFRSSSRYSGDWEMWFKLVSRYGGAHSGAEVVVVRAYEDWRKGTSRVSQAGQNHLATIVQRKRNYAWLKRAGKVGDIDLKSLRDKAGISLKYLIWYGGGFSQRMLDYNVRLFLSCRPRSLRQRVLQIAIRLGRSGLVRLCSRLCRIWERVR
jgi:glycosyltransferase involved in cell wall biosynthesis